MSYIVGLGELMLRLSSLDSERLLQSAMLNATFGGVEANVCVSVARFGLKARYVTAFPDNVLGRKAEELLLGQKVDTSCIVWKGKRLGLYFLDMGYDHRPSSVTYDREYSAISEVSYEDFNWDKIFDDAEYFHITGVTPGISERARELTIYAVKEAKKRNVKVSCDINYRKKLWKYGKNIWDVMPEIVEQSDILFANEYDVVKILGIKSDLDVDGIINDEEYTNLMSRTIEKYNLSSVITTKREVKSSSYNIFSSKAIMNGKLYKSKKYDINNIVDRVGSGDAFVGGILSGLYLFNNPQEILEFATASSCIKHSIYGDWNITNKEEVMSLMNSKGTGDVSR